ncbi:MAG: AmmeMemoRadiSam system protein B [Nitrospina sp.]|nr:AmmeMemoRadiSam system protein B [Nitrospina sp.]
MSALKKNKRIPAVAGKFYSANRYELEKNIKGHLINPLQKKHKAIGMVSPHAGLMYSGAVAGAIYSQVEIPDTVILIGPNHTGRGESVSIMTQGTWAMPMGDVSLDDELAQLICEETPIAIPDPLAHEREHSLETQIPFLQYLKKNLKIVPICLKKINYSHCKKLSLAIVRSLKRAKKTALIVASSDMTHFESHEVAQSKDKKALCKIENRDPHGLHEIVQQEKISMCGVNPVTVMLLCSEQLGAKKAEVVKYITSGEINGDKNKVVGYAGVIVT